MGNMKSVIGTSSVWVWEQWKLASRRSGAYILYDTWTETNLTTDEGITHALDVVFSDGAQKGTWYLALFNDDYTPLAGDTYQSPGYTESANYDEGARPTWQEAGVVAKSISNVANVAAFTMNTDETIYGGSLVSANTKADLLSGEILYCSSAFTAEKAVEDDDILKVTATLSGQDV